MTKKSLAELAEESGASKNDAPDALDEIKTSTTEIDIEKLREHNIFFATPCYGGLLTDQYFLSMFKMQQTLIRDQIDFRITTLRNESLVTRARNILVAMFLESNCSHLMFIDADIEFEPDSIIRMLAMDKDIITGAYPKKTLPVDYAVNFKFIDPQHKKVNVDNGAVEVLDASTGFFMIKRKVLEKMILEYPELHYKNDSSIDKVFNEHCYAFFDTGIDPRDNRYLSEDYFFCRKWQDIGGKIWMDPNTKLNHVGSYTFEGNVNQLMSWVPEEEEKNSKE